jgi:mannose-6-phosphate isomerase-like protein (cupin superfamily)
MRACQQQEGAMTNLRLSGRRLRAIRFTILALLAPGVLAPFACATSTVHEPPWTMLMGQTQAAATSTATSSELPGLESDGWTPGTVGASVASPLLLRHDQIPWGPPPPILSPAASMAVIEGDVDARGKLVTFRLRMPDGYRIAPHWHFADEHVTILSGGLKIGHGDTFDATRMETLPVGSFAVLPARHHHYVMAEGETEIQVHAVGPWKLIYIHPDDDPSRKP